MLRLVTVSCMIRSNMNKEEFYMFLWAVAILIVFLSPIYFCR
jgi:hypothetical protein